MNNFIPLILKRFPVTCRLIVCLLVAVFLFPFTSLGQEPIVHKRTPDSSNSFENKVEQKERASSHFTWGAEVGTSIDISGYDSSTFNADALIGYKNDLLRFLGLGIGFHRAMGNGDNYVPVYVALRTSFTKQPKLFFMALKAGYSFNTIGDAETFGDINASIGVGINLKTTERFQSYISLGYEFRHFSLKHREAISIDAQNISMAKVSFGVNF